MSNDTPKDELVVSVQKAVKIEEIEGKKVARFSVDPLLQGHTFSIELTLWR